MPVLRPQMALNGIEVCMRTAGTLSARSFVMCFVAKEVVAASEEDSQILKLEENAVGFERTVLHDMRTKERRRLNDATAFNSNHSENEEFALG